MSVRRNNDPRRQQRWLESRQDGEMHVPDPALVASAQQRCVRATAQYTLTDPGADYPGDDVGTGVIVKTGLVVTNWHLGECSPGEGRVLRRILFNGHEAALVHFDIRLDLAAYAVKTRRLSMIKFKDMARYGNRHVPHADKIRIGDPVFYVGNPDELSKSMWTGVVGKTSEREQKIYASTMTAYGMSGSGMYCQKTGALVGLVDSMELCGIDGEYKATVAVPAYLVKSFIHQALGRMERQPRARIPSVRRDEPSQPSPVPFDFEERRYE